MARRPPAEEKRTDDHRGGDEATFPDDWLFDLCGIEADVTVDERWMLKEFPDGSETLHTVRTYTSSDPRIPTEKGAATSFNAPDGSRVVVGTPLHLFDAGRPGPQILDAGRIAFDPAGDPVRCAARTPSSISTPSTCTARKSV